MTIVYLNTLFRIDVDPTRDPSLQMHDETEQAIDDALEGKPRAGEIAEMIDALVLRRVSFERERDAAGTDEQRKSWSQRLKEVDRQIDLLRQEMAITDFVERSVRAAAARPRPILDEEIQ